MEVHERLLERDPEYRRRQTELEFFTRDYLARIAGDGLRSGIVVIPVVVHVVDNTAAENVSDAQIQSQIDVLNQDYRKLNGDFTSAPGAFQPVAADARVQFQLAVRDPNCNATTGITRTQTTVASFTNNDAVKAAATGGADPWPSDQYLNLWVCNLGGGLLGYAQFPGGPAATDGVVITYTGFGNTGTAAAPYNLGRTATHEIGHWLNLHHVWGDAICGDDFVADTPVQQGPNFGCPAFPHVTCGNGPNGDMFCNYMDYVDDHCMVMFTAGQSARMDAALAGARAPILASPGLVPPPPVVAAVLWSKDVGADTGVEPDPSPDPMWLSDDIWVRNTNDGRTVQDHQDPVYRPGGPPNYVYVRVRNRGCQAGGSGTVKLYWAKASTALGWPAPWDGSVTVPALMGSTIGAQPVANVAGGGSAILEFAWSPPNPNDYASFGADKNHFCLLSRIETASAPPYGMTFPEGGNLYANVQNNNKIVWKNVSVIGTAREPGRLAWITIGTTLGRPAPMRLTFTSPVEGSQELPALLKTHTVSIDLGPELSKRWQAGGSAADGFDVRGGRLQLDRSGAWIGNLEIHPGELHTFSVAIHRKDENEQGNDVFFLDVAQAVDEGAAAVIGGQRVVLKTVHHRRHLPHLPWWIFGDWTHSHEEDEEEVAVFRHHDFPFPRSRGRDGFELTEDGAIVLHEIAPTDGIQRVAGTWHAETETTILVTFQEMSRRSLRLEVIAGEPGLLRGKWHPV
jgi:hypothetical protein